MGTSYGLCPECREPIGDGEVPHTRSEDWADVHADCCSDCLREDLERIDRTASIA